MSVHIYGEETKLTNVVGRVAYAADPKRQKEKLLAVAGNTDVNFWQLLASDCRAKFTPRMHKVKKADGTVALVPDECCEGRELMVVLPNCWLRLPIEEQRRKLAGLSNFVKQLTGTENLVALHNSHAGKDGEGNAHVHIIMAERIRLEKPEDRVAERKLFIDERGVRRYKKSEIMDDNGALRDGCKVVPKGAFLYTQYFSEKVSEMKQKSWLYDMKYHLVDWINTELKPDEKREVYDPKGPYLAQKHIGKGCPDEIAKRLKRWNGLVKQYNEFVRKGYISREDAVHYKTRIALSPNRTEELKAVLGEFYLERLPENQHRPSFERSLDRAGSTPRTKKTSLEEEKRKLRKLYKASTVARKKSKDAESLQERIEAVSEAREISMAIEVMRHKLGYDESMPHDRRQEIYKIARDQGRQSAAQRRSAQKKAYEERAHAYETMYNAKEDRDLLRGKWTYDETLNKYVYAEGILKEGDPRIAKAEDDFNAAREEYTRAKKAAAACRQAEELIGAYKKFALELAGDVTVPEKDVERARERYLRTLRQLENPTPEKVRELSKQLKDLRKSQALRDEKRRNRESEEKKRGLKDFPEK